MAKNLMIQGTMSNAGKSIVTAGILRVLKQDGYKAAPFKSQNMALNSYVTRDGENQHKESILVMITNVYHITLKEMPMRIL